MRYLLSHSRYLISPGGKLILEKAPHKGSNEKYSLEYSISYWGYLLTPGGYYTISHTGDKFLTLGV